MAALRVAIDLTALEQPAARLGREAMSVRFVEALTQHAPDVQFVVLARPITHTALAHLDAANVRRLAIAEPSRFGSVLARLGARVQRRLARPRVADRLGWLPDMRPVRRRWRAGLLARLGANVVFCPFTPSGMDDRSVPLVAAVHDLQHLSHPHLLSSAERGARARALAAMLGRADRIVCSAPSLRDNVLGGAGLVAARVLSVPPGRLLAHTAATQADVAATLARLGLEQNGFFLLAADFEARHNHRLVLTALAIFRARYPDSRMRLVCVGGPDAAAASFKTMAAQMGLGAAVQVAGNLAGEEVTALIQASRALIDASLYETVGESVLEAMQLGRPVVCSQIPDLAELTGGAALTFDPHRPAELAAAFERVERDADLLVRLGQLGRARVATLDDPHSVAQAYVAALDEARTACPTSR